ncbi:uncharacterized protein LOC143103691 [Alosa pseudoharengus]|uniref:uncharacterized protein LOC143103691 n=1 Tax=Alosa pseudoharengus TaxID=34774 RepID=UPI003F8B285A
MEKTGNPSKKFKNASGAPVKKRQQRFSSEIVFTAKNGSIQTIPSLQKKLADVTGECLVGLQYVWEYRSPSKSVPPHYQCRLCKVAKLQSEILRHIQGWKHFFKYLKQHHGDKVTCTEEEATNDRDVRKTVRDVALEVEKTEGRGKIRVVLKEPSEVPVFQGMNSAKPKLFKSPIGAGPGGHRAGLGPRPQPGLYGYGDFPSGGGMPDFAVRDGLDRRDLADMRGMRDFRDTLDLHMSPRGSDMGMRRYSAGGTMQPTSDCFGMRVPGEGLDRSSYINDFRGGQGTDLSDPMMRTGMKEGNSIPATLLKYLDSFRIESESDAQIVLKVTQKLTDVLMEYRLRSMSPGKTTPPSLGPMSYTNSSDRYSSGMGGPSRYYN